MRASITAISFAFACSTLGTTALAATSVPAASLLRRPATARDSHNQWHWIAVEATGANTTGWAVTAGTGTVHVDGSSFRADLRLNHDEQGADISLRGRVDRESVRATETLLNTDANPVAITGRLHVRSLGKDWVEERIIFRGGQSGDASYLGLYRVVARTGAGQDILGG